MFCESRLVVSVCRFLPLVPCVGSPLSDVSHLDCVIFESDIQGLAVSPMQLIGQFMHLILQIAATYLLVSFLSFNLNRCYPMVLAGLKALEIPCFFSTLVAASETPFTYVNTANQGISFPSRLSFSFSTFFPFPSFCLTMSSTNLKFHFVYQHCMRASLMLSISSFQIALSKTKVLYQSNRVWTTPNF